MLREHPAKRPNIYQVMQQICRMRGKEIPIRDVCAAPVSKVKSNGSRFILGEPTRRLGGISSYHLHRGTLLRALELRYGHLQNKKSKAYQILLLCDAGDHQSPFPIISHPDRAPRHYVS